MFRINLKYSFSLRHRLSGRFQNPPHLHTHIIFTDHKTGGRICQSVRHPDFSHLFLQQFGDPLYQSGHLRGRCFWHFLLVFALKLTQIQFTTGHILERLTIKL